MNVPSWLKTIAFCQIAALASVSCSAQDGTWKKTGVSAHINAPAPTQDKQENVGALPQPGEYVTNSGWGRLLVSQLEGNSASFNIQSVNGEDVCDLSGKIINGNGIAIDDSSKTSCVIKFTESDGDINISTGTQEECKHFCGWNGGFEGTYTKVSEGCRSEKIEFARREFKQLYDQKQYKSALSKLSPVLDNCSSLLDWEEVGGVRNDIAIAQHKAGLNSSCLKTLEPYAEDAKKDDGEVVESWPPALSDRYLAIIKASRTNIRLCSDNVARSAA